MIISIVEGFDRVGKSKVIKDLSVGLEEAYDKVFIYKPPYKGLDLKFDKTSAGWILGYASLDAFIQSGLVDSNCHVIFDRHIASSWVYNRIYGTGVDVDNSVVMEDLRLLSMFKKVSHYYVSHSDHLSAKFIYDATLKGGEHTDPLDHFTSFLDYWDSYNIADELFKKFYLKYQINFTSLASVSRDDGYILQYNQ